MDTLRTPDAGRLSGPDLSGRRILTPPSASVPPVSGRVLERRSG